MQTALASAEGTAVSNGHDWFEFWFDSAHYQRLYGYRDETEAATLVDRLVDRLRPRPGAGVLDLACGSGRHARRLASHGLKVVGIDLAGESFRCAQAGAHAWLRFYRHVMRRPFGRRRFDLICNFFTSFAYFEDQADNGAVVRNVARALVGGGRFVLDYLNVARAARRPAAEETREIDGVTFTLTRWQTPDHFFKRIVVDDGQTARPREIVERVAKFGLRDFQAMFIREGLIVDEIYGDYNLAAYDADTSPRLILVARNAAPAWDALAGDLLAGEMLPDPAQGLGCQAQV
jgi:SAM-dependent methyltransferase